MRNVRAEKLGQLATRLRAMLAGSARCCNRSTSCAQLVRRERIPFTVAAGHRVQESGRATSRSHFAVEQPVEQSSVHSARVGWEREFRPGIPKDNADGLVVPALSLRLVALFLSSAPRIPDAHVFARCLGVRGGGKPD